MRNLSLALAALFLFSIPAGAATAPSLKQNMKQLGGLFKQIGATLRDPTKNAANAKNAEAMQKLLVVIREQAPDSVGSLPPAEQPKALAEYQAMIDEQGAWARDLQAAFLADDNVRAADLAQKMDFGKKDGHNRFR